MAPAVANVAHAIKEANNSDYESLVLSGIIDKLFKNMSDIKEVLVVEGQVRCSSTCSIYVTS